MDPDDRPLSCAPNGTSSHCPSSSSAPIAVNMHPAPQEEDVYAVAEAMRKAMHAQSKIKGKTPEPAFPDLSDSDIAAAMAAGSQTSLSAAATTSPKTSLRRSPATSPNVTSPRISTTTTTTTTSTVPSAPASARPPSRSESEYTSRPASTMGSQNGEAPSAADNQPASMTSSVRDHVYEGGLRYHAYRAGKYAFPNDETEQNRDDMKHTMTLMLCGGAYFYAPVEEVLERGAEVLDLGTGTGIWAMELGDRYPRSTFTGIDLSPIQPTFVPENVHFFVDDFEEEWVDPDNKYDFIHLRHTLHSVQDPDALLARVFRHLKPGGYFEVQELVPLPASDDGTLTDDTPYALRDYLRFMSEGLRARGSDPHAILSMPDRLAAAGFTGVRRTVHKCPLGVWPRDKRLRFCGLFMRTALMDGLRGISRRPLAALGWTALQIEMFLVEVRKAIMDEGKHVYFPLHVVYGRKPV